MPIEWTDDLNIGVEEIDAQHREFHASVGEFLTTMRSGHRDRLPALLFYLDAYLAEHCATEERFMAKYSYPGAAAHRALHQDIMATCQRYSAAPPRPAPQPITLC